MADFLTASLVLALLVFSVSVSAGQRIIPAKPGDKATLTCGEVQNTDVKVVEWSRTDLESEKPVLLYRLSQSVPEDQSPFFKDRVDLVAMKKGNVSLVLKNVTTDDTGTYECRVKRRGNNRRKRSLQDTEPVSIIPLRSQLGGDPICTFNLTVEPPKKCEAAANQGNTSRKRRSVDTDCNNPGNQDGGNKDGLKEDGGNKDGPKEDGGNKDGPKEDGGNEDGPKEGGGSLPGLMVGASVCAVVVLLVAAVLYKRSRYSSLKSKRPPAAADAEKTLTGLDE